MFDIYFAGAQINLLISRICLLDMIVDCLAFLFFVE